MTIEFFLNHLLKNDFIYIDGIWHSNTSANLSYPEEGYDNCFDLEENSFWFRHRNNCLIAVIKKYSKDNCFFDIGGGNGFVAKGLENNQITSILIEPGKRGVLNAKKRDLENIFCGTLNDLSGLAGQIPSIGTFDVIEHIEDDKEFIKEIHTMLVKDGTFFVTVPAFQNLWSDEDVDAGHYRRYNLKSIKELLTQNGFEIIYSTYFFSFLLFPIFLIRALPSKLKIRNNSKSKTQKEHNQNNRFIGKIMNSIWKWELNRISHQKSIPFGTSCLIVAKKSE